MASDYIAGGSTHRKSLKNKTSKAKITYTQPSFAIHAFTTVSNDIKIVINVIKMDKSLFIWIGTASEPSFTDLSMAMMGLRGDKPLATSLMDPAVESASVSIAGRLCKKLNKQVFMSFNITVDRLTLPFVEKRICEEIDSKPQCF